MKQKINILENMEYIKSTINNIVYAMTKSVDYNIFQEKIIDDIYYSDVFLKRMTQIVEENIFFSKNIEILNKLIDIKQSYVFVIEDLIRNSVLNNENGIKSDILDEIITSQNFEILKLKGIKRANPGYIKHEEDLISPEEYRCLIM